MSRLICEKCGKELDPKTLIANNVYNCSECGLVEAASTETSKKYELTEETFLGCRRIVALRDFGAENSEKHYFQVKKGDRGGFIESEANLSHEGNCWVKDSARVSGNAKVYEDALIENFAVINGNARVYGSSKVNGRSHVCDNAKVYGNSEISGNSRVAGKAKVHATARIQNNAEVSGDAEICGYVRIGEYAKVSGKSKVYGYTDVFGKAEIKGSVKIKARVVVDGDVVLNGNIEISSLEEYEAERGRIMREHDKGRV